MSTNQPPAQFPQYDTTPQPGQQPSTPAPTGKPPRNTIGLVALAASIIGFIFAVMEGAYIIGWILLPIAFVLSLVALFQRDRSKKAALAALIISIVGTMAGGIAFMGTVGRAFESATGGTVTAAPSPVTAGTQSEPAAEPAAQGGNQGVAQGDQGTRSNPYPLGSSIANNEWQVTVNSFTADATGEIRAENRYTDDPEAGHTYALANVTVTRLGQEAASPLFDVSVKYVTAAGNVVDSSDTFVMAPEPLSSNELYEGASTTGNIALQIPEGDDGLLRVTLGLFSGDDMFFATK